MVILFYAVESKYSKIHKQEISSTAHNVLEFFLCAPKLSIHKTYQVASPCDKNVEW